MKKYIPVLLSSFFVFGNSFAADLEATVIDSELGESIGEIDLDVNAGVAPFEFNWTGPDGFSSTDEDLSGLISGTYTVTVTDLYCGMATLEVEVENAAQSSIEEETIFRLSVYPNPTTGMLYLSSNEQLDIIVYNVMGEKVLVAKNVTEIDLSGNPAGIYMVQATSAKGVLTRKITLQ